MSPTSGPEMRVAPTSALGTDLEVEDLFIQPFDLAKPLRCWHWEEKAAAKATAVQAARHQSLECESLSFRFLQLCVLACSSG